MEIILMIMFIILVNMLLKQYLPDDSDTKQPTVVAVKQCPPHKWGYVEVKDTEGTTVKWEVVCAVCGPMVAPERPKNGDYT
jgi:hypothetical protein